MRIFFVILLCVLDLSAKINFGIISAVDKQIKELKTKKDKAILKWVGSDYYKNDGLNFECGNNNTNFIYKVIYQNFLNKPPVEGYPKVHILYKGSEVAGSPFTMTRESGNYKDGITYSYVTNLIPEVNNYSYYFEAKYIDEDKVEKTIFTDKIDYPAVSDGNGLNSCWQVHFINYDGYEPSLAFDSSGNPVILFISNSYEEIRNHANCRFDYYTQKTVCSCPGDYELVGDDVGGYWCEKDVINFNLNIGKIQDLSKDVFLSEIIYTTTSTVKYPSLKIGTDNNFRISYIKDIELWYGRTIDNIWAFGKIINNASESHIYLSTTNMPHISYYDIVSKKLGYCFYFNTSWQCENPDILSADNGQDNDIFVSTDGIVNISYYDASHRVFMYAYKNNGEWAKEVVGFLTEAGKNSNIIRDNTDSINIFYSDNGSLKHAKKLGTNFSVSSLNSEGFVSYSSVGMIGDKIYVVYQDEISKSLKSLIYDGTKWDRKEIDINGYYPSVNTYETNVGVVYSSNGAIKYAFWIK
ncbi:MAG: hypothetical protein QXJ06_05190 [Candidatus Aenigmatarchaeota archaeon]